MTEETPIMRDMIIIAIVFTAVLILAVPATAHGGSHEDDPDLHEGEYTIQLQIIDSVTQETITGDIEAANKSLEDVSVASLDVPEGEVKISATAEGYSSITDTVNVTRSDISRTVSLEPKKQELKVTTVGSKGEPLKVDSISTKPEGVESSSKSSNTSVHTVEEAYQGYTYKVEAISNGTVAASEDVEIQDGDTELEIVVSDQTEIPVIGVDIRSTLFAVVSSLFGLGITGLIVLYTKRKR